MFLGGVVVENKKEEHSQSEEAQRHLRFRRAEQEITSDTHFELPYIERADKIRIGSIYQTTTMILDDPNPAPGYDIHAEPWQSARQHLVNLYLQETLINFVSPILVPDTLETKSEMIEWAHQSDSDLRKLGHYPDQYDPLIQMHGAEHHLKLADIFDFPIKMERTIKSARHILLQGRPGAGKTTTISWLAQQWCSIESPLKNYAWVFKIDLRELVIGHSDLLKHPDTTLADILYSYFFKKSSHLNKQQVQSIISFHRENPREILFILDGFNELPNINETISPGLAVLLQTSFTTLITSRLCHAEYAKEYCQSDLVINLLGFDERTLRAYVQKRAFVLAPDSPQDAHKKSTQLMDYLEKQNALWSFAHIPMNIYWITRLWINANGDIQQLVTFSTITDLFNKIIDVVIQEDLNKQPGNPRSAERKIRHKNAEKEAIDFLEYLAFEAMATEHWLISEDVYLEKFAHFFPERTHHLAKELAKSLTEDSPFINMMVISNEQGDEIIYYSFTHATFQEYFAARYLAKKSKEDLKKFVSQHRFDAHYQMMLIFVAGQISRNPVQDTLLLPAMFQAIDSLPMEITELPSMLLRISWLNECTVASQQNLYEHHPITHKKIQQAVVEALTKPEQQKRESLIDFFRYCSAVFSHTSVSSIITQALFFPEMFKNIQDVLVKDPETIQYRAVRLICGVRRVPSEWLNKLASIAGSPNCNARFEAAQALGYAESPDLTFKYIVQLLSIFEQQLYVLDTWSIAFKMILRLRACLFYSAARLLRRYHYPEFVVYMINKLIHQLGDGESYTALSEKEFYTPDDVPYEYSAAIVAGLGEIRSCEGVTGVGDGIRSIMDVQTKAMMETVHFIALTLQSYQSIPVIKTGIRALDNMLKYNIHLFNKLLQHLSSVSSRLYMRIAIAYACLHVTYITPDERQQFHTVIKTSLNSERNLDSLLEAVFKIIDYRLTRNTNDLSKHFQAMLTKEDTYLRYMALFFIAEFHLNEPAIFQVLLKLLRVDPGTPLTPLTLSTLKNLGPRNADEIESIFEIYQVKRNPAYLSLLTKIGAGVPYLYNILKANFFEKPSCERAEDLINYGRIEESILDKILEIINGPDTLQFSRRNTLGLTGSNNVLFRLGDTISTENNVNQRAAELLSKLNLIDYMSLIVEKVPEHFLSIVIQGTPLLPLIKHFSSTGEWLELCISKAINSSITLLYNDSNFEWTENNEKHCVSVTNEFAREQLLQLIQKRQLRSFSSLPLTNIYLSNFNQLPGENTMPIDQKKLDELLKQANNLQVTYDNLKSTYDAATQSQNQWLVALKSNESAGFAQYPFHPSDYECACLAEKVYPGAEVELLEGWECIRTAVNTSDGYIGSAYWHPVHRHLVIAHRGTADTAGWLTDAHAIGKGNIDFHMASATKFALDTIMKMANVTLSVTVTGHSLGGWLAQVTGYHLAEMAGIHPHIVAFESPGSFEMLTHLLPDRERKVNIEDLDITIYLSSPNYINTFGKHPKSATVYHVPSIEHPWKANWKNIEALGYIEYLQNVHSMKHLREAFDSTTGSPRLYYRMLRWPTTTIPQGATNHGMSIKILGAIKDLLINRNEQQLSEFLTFARALDDLSLTDQGILSFDSDYFIAHSARFQKAPSNEPVMVQRMTAFSPKIREFLDEYLEVRKYLSGEKGRLLLQAHNQIYAQKGYTQLSCLLNNYDSRAGILTSPNNPIFVSYILHITQLCSDITVFKSHVFEEILKQLDEAKNNTNNTSQALLAREANEFYVGQVISGQMFIGKDTPKDMYPQIIEKYYQNIDKVAPIPPLVGKFNKGGVFQHYNVGIQFSNPPEPSFDQKGFGAFVAAIQPISNTASGSNLPDLSLQKAEFNTSSGTSHITEVGYFGTSASSNALDKSNQQSENQKMSPEELDEFNRKEKDISLKK